MRALHKRGHGEKSTPHSRHCTAELDWRMGAYDAAFERKGYARFDSFAAKETRAVARGRFSLFN